MATPLVRAAADHWVAVATADSLDDGPVAATVLGEDLAIVRLDDDVVAFPDRCAHRGAPLSEGHLAASGTIDGVDQSCLVCPYHAVHYDSSGTAVHLPARPDARLPGRLDLAPLPVEVRHGLVWVCPSGSPVSEPPDWSAFDRSDTVHFQLEPVVWDVAPGRIVENFNDMAHFATIHAATFGDGSATELPPICVEADATAIRHVARMQQLDRITLDGTEEPIVVAYSYDVTLPFASQLRIDFAEDRTEWIQMTVAPIDDDRAVVFQQNVRNFDLDGDLQAWADFQEAVNLEDQTIIERLRPRHIRPDGADAGEVALNVDDFTIAYRRYWAELLRNV